AASDEPLDLYRAPTGTAARLAGRARMRGARQHAVLRRDPALILALQMGRHFLFDRRRADHARIAHLDQARAFGIGHKAARQFHRTHLIAAAPIRSWHNASFPSQSSKKSIGKRDSLAV